MWLSENRAMLTFLLKKVSIAVKIDFALTIAVTEFTHFFYFFFFFEKSRLFNIFL